MPPRRTKKKKKRNGLPPVLAGFLAGAAALGALVAFLFWPRTPDLSLAGLSREDAARLVAQETERRFERAPLSDAGEIVSVENGVNIPWSVIWQGSGDAALILAEQAVRDFWGTFQPAPQVKVIYPDHAKRGERVRLVASREGRALVEVLLLESETPTEPAPPAPSPRPKPRPSPPVTPRPPDNPPPVEPGGPVPPPPGPSHPAPGRTVEPAGPPPRGRIALIIDDIGNERTVVDKLLAIPAPLTFAVMPNSLYGPELARKISATGAEVMLHLPMEPLDLADNDPGPGALLLSMTPAQVDASLAAALLKVPMAAGVNNHMGSAFTGDRVHMEALLRAIGRRGLYFIDSRTCPDSFGVRRLPQLGVRGGERRVFLDHVASEAETEARLYELARAAEAGGVPIGIGHPYPETVAALRRLLPKLLAEGFVLVPASEAVQ